MTLRRKDEGVKAFYKATKMKAVTVTEHYKLGYALNGLNRKKRQSKPMTKQ